VLTEGNPRVVSPLASNGLDELHVSIYWRKLNKTTYNQCNEIILKQ
jgi:hypothetical protein